MPSAAAPTLPFLHGPTPEAGYRVWQARHRDVEVRFTGRGPHGSNEDRESVLRAIEPGAPPLAWAKQIHSATALPARAGFCGEGDALYTEEAGLALSVITADCVPVLLAGPEGLAAIHAGWRGIVSRVIEATLQKMSGLPEEWTAWVGPAIGACCYEVDAEVAARVTGASGSEIAIEGPAGKPHLDLPGAARLQLERAGVGEVIVLPRCTRCDAANLWSYRREGKGAGRNVGLIWRRPQGQSPSRRPFM
jgi:YfiH family protein